MNFICPFCGSSSVEIRRRGENLFKVICLSCDFGATNKYETSLKRAVQIFDANHEYLRSKRCNQMKQK